MWDGVVRILLVPFAVIAAGILWFIDKAESLRDWRG